MARRPKRILLFLAVFSTPCRAEPAPTLKDWYQKPYSYEETTLTNGVKQKIEINALDRFADRRRDTVCRQRYSAARSKYFAARKELQAAQDEFKAGKIDKTALLAQETSFRSDEDDFLTVMDLGKEIRQVQVVRASGRNRQLSFKEATERIQRVLQESDSRFIERSGVEVCGDCMVPNMEIREANEGLSPQYWYQSSGFCSMEDLEPHLREEAAQKAAAFLRTPLSYPKLFTNVLEFLPFEGNHFIKDFTTAGETESFDAYMAVRGPKILNMPTAYGYFIRNTPKVTTNGAFELAFTATSNNGLRQPDIYEVSITGDKKRVSAMGLNEVIGWWLLEPGTGLIRYSMAAKFGARLDSLKALARRVHLETLSSFLHEFFLTEDSETK